jgi:hypothetical protein
MKEQMYHNYAGEHGLTVNEHDVSLDGCIRVEECNRAGEHRLRLRMSSWSWEYAQNISFQVPYVVVFYLLENPRPLLLF